MTKSACTLSGNPSAVFQTIMDMTLPLSIGPTEATFLILFVVAFFFGVVYSKHLHICISYLASDGIG
jgi:hypothetical protein